MFQLETLQALPQGSLDQGTPPPTIVTIEHKNFLIEASSYPGPESEDSDERIVLSTPPSQRTPATGSSPTPELGDRTHSFSPTHEPRNVDNSPLLSLSPLLHPPFSPINAPTPTATAADGSNAMREASSTAMDNGSTQLSVGAPPFPPPSALLFYAHVCAYVYIFSCAHSYLCHDRTHVSKLVQSTECSVKMTGRASFSVDAKVWEYHQYKAISISQVLTCQWEIPNAHDPFAVAVTKSNDRIVGHVPRRMSCTCLCRAVSGVVVRSPAE